MNRIILQITAAAGIALATASAVFGQYDGCSLYVCREFPGDAWPTYPVPATSVSIGNPTGVAVDAAGYVYIAGPSIVFKLNASGMLTRIAGNGHNGYSGDGGPATDAVLGFPRATPNDFIDFWDVTANLATDSSGNLYIADFFNNRVRKITPEGVISTLVGDGFGKPFGWPGGVAVGPAGDVYVVGSFDTVWRETPDGATPLMSNNCGHPYALGLCVPYGAATDSNGNVYVADTGNCRVLKRSPDGSITIVAGDGRPSNGFVLTCGYSGDGGQAVPAATSGPYGLAVDAAGNLYLADTYNNRIRKVSSDGIITTVAGRGPSYAFQYKGGYSGDGYRRGTESPACSGGRLGGQYLHCRHGELSSSQSHSRRDHHYHRRQWSLVLRRSARDIFETVNSFRSADGGDFMSRLSSRGLASGALHAAFSDYPDAAFQASLGRRTRAARRSAR